MVFRFFVHILYLLYVPTTLLIIIVFFLIITQSQPKDFFVWLNHTKYLNITTARYSSNQIRLLAALEGLAAVVNRVTCSAPVPGSTLYVHACHPRGALPAPGLAGCPVGRGE
jgi:hypothetical protein